MVLVMPQSYSLFNHGSVANKGTSAADWPNGEPHVPCQRRHSKMIAPLDNQKRKFGGVACVKEVEDAWLRPFSYISFSSFVCSSFSSAISCCATRSVGSSSWPLFLENWPLLPRRIASINANIATLMSVINVMSATRPSAMLAFSCSAPL